MSWRTIVISKSAKLDFSMGYLVVRGENTKKVHLGEIYMVIIETTAVSLTAALLAELSKRKIKVVFCDEKRNPSSELISYYGSHDTSLKVKMQIDWSDDIKRAVWTDIVTEKIRKQADHLSDYNKLEAEKLRTYIDELTFGDATNREGHAAKVYFNALFGMDFTRDDENSINAALNYGYSLLLSCFTREIVANGYLTQIGLFHDNMFNRFNLASDFMEPFRPIVDRKVRNYRFEKFETDEKHIMLGILESEIMIAGRKEIFTNAVRIYTKSIFDALNQNDCSLIKFYV
ncbi:MAG: type II CRISPR-associated endonuclease Cas1 [Lachnospiraceae bacterium]|nr:type II CRISPR-associated endonuclease Cas1 [Lachnospiraceae bacterium]